MVFESANLENYKEIDAWKTEPSCEKEHFDQLIKVITDAGITVDKAPFDEIVDNYFAKKVK